MVNDLSPLHCRVAREVLGWTQMELARRSTLSYATVKRFELGKAVHPSFADSLMRTFSEAGVVLYGEGDTVDGRDVRMGVILVRGSG